MLSPFLERRICLNEIKESTKMMVDSAKYRLAHVGHASAKHCARCCVHASIREVWKQKQAAGVMSSHGHSSPAVRGVQPQWEMKSSNQPGLGWKEGNLAGIPVTLSGGSRREI